jgi:hypothetical protein
MTNPFATIGLGLLGSAQQGYYSPAQAQNQLAATPQYWAQQAQQAQAFAQYAQQEAERQDWMINGVRMTFKEFADTLYPEDSPERTMFYLKYSK